MVSKEEIEKAKEQLENKINYLQERIVIAKDNPQTKKSYIEEMSKEKQSIEILLQYIDQLEADNYELNNRLNDYIENDKKQNKMIDEILKEYVTCQTCLDYTCKKRNKNAKECIKQYFEKKVDEEKC